jgi:hypothetical protein
MVAAVMEVLRDRIKPPKAYGNLHRVLAAGFSGKQ